MCRFANQIVFEVATSLTKLSILTLLYRLTTASRDRNVTIAVLISIGAISVNCVVFIIVSSLQCMYVYRRRRVKEDRNLTA